MKCYTNDQAGEAPDARGGHRRAERVLHAADGAPEQPVVAALQHEEPLEEGLQDAARRVDGVLRHPAIDELPREQPLARDPRRRQLSRRDQRVDLLRVELQVPRDLAAGEVVGHVATP